MFNLYKNTPRKVTLVPKVIPTPSSQSSKLSYLKKYKNLLIIGVVLLFGILGLWLIYFFQTKLPPVVKTIEVAQDSIHLYENISGDFDVKFGYTENGEQKHLIKYISKNNEDITMQLLDTNTDLKAYKTQTTNSKGEKVDVVKFDGIYKDTSSYYQITDTSVKEVIRLDSKEAPQEFKYSLVTNGVEMSKGTNGEYVFKKGENMIFSFVPLFMEDAKNVKTYEVGMDIKYVKDGDKGEKIYEMVVTPSKEWLNAEDRAYPVLIDPSLLFVNK